jgi:hypothetical protein
MLNGPGIGKSLRVERSNKFLPPAWESDTSSDDLGSRLAHYQEIRNSHTILYDTVPDPVVDSSVNRVHYLKSVSTNCGPLGLKDDVEPSPGREALQDRSWIPHHSRDKDATPQGPNKKKRNDALGQGAVTL